MNPITNANDSLIERNEGPTFQSVTPSQPVQPKKSSVGCVILIIIFLVFSCVITSCIGSFFFLSAISTPEVPAETVGFDSNVRKSTPTRDDDYIDPSVKEDADDLIIDSGDNFNFRFKSSVDGTQYQYEKDFVMANVQQQYIELSEKFGYGLEYKINIVYTDSQDDYHTDFGREFNYELQHAAFATYGEMEIFVNPDYEIDKQDLKRLISHELVHIFQFDNLNMALSDTPAWFNEGSAEYLSGSPLYDLDSLETPATIEDLDDLEELFSSGEYDQSLSGYLVANYFVTYLAEKYGEDKVLNVIKEEDPTYKSGNGFNRLFLKEFGITPDDAFEEWRESVY